MDRQPVDRAARRPRRELSARQLEMRRKRNRESMRRVRVRQQSELQARRAQLAALERTLAALQLAREFPPDTTDASKSDTIRRAASTADAEVARLEKERRALQEQLRAREALHDELSTLLLGCGSSTPSSPVLSGLAPILSHRDDPTDEFAWVQRVLPLLPALSPGRVSLLARESYLDTVRYLRLAEEEGWASATSASSHVLGWSDRRVVDGERATFLFAKAFAHEDVDVLTAKTWKVLTLANQSSGFQVRDLHLRVVQRLNDDTLIMARNIFFPKESRFYSALYVLVRVKTVDGYVISGRSILPPAGLSDDELSRALGSHRVYVFFHYGMSFSLMTTLDACGHVAASGGCSVRYGESEGTRAGATKATRYKSIGDSLRTFDVWISTLLLDLRQPRLNDFFDGLAGIPLPRVLSFYCKTMP